MPDWTYQTVFKPVLLRLPYRRARGLALGLMGTLARLPGGTKVIDFFGHMRPADCLETSWQGIGFPSPVGLGDGFDPHLTASEALARFGFGFFDIGPVVADGQAISQPQVVVDSAQEEICLAGRAETISRQQVLEWFERRRNADLPVIVRISAGNFAAEWPCQLVDAVGGGTVLLAWFAEELLSGADPERARATEKYRRDSASGRCRSLLVVPTTLNDELMARVAEFINSALYDGVLIDGSYEMEGTDRNISGHAFASARSATRAWRDRLGDGGWIISSGGIHAPWQAMALIEEGANLIEVDSGLVFAGPGLPKRINEAIERGRLSPTWDIRKSSAHGEPRVEHLPDAKLHQKMRIVHQSWFWTLLLGMSMLAGGLLTGAIAASRVVMPYDESLTDMTRAQIETVNDHLLDFMRHDRATLAGTMVAVGILYSALSWFGSRRGIHWAHAAITWSAFAGFFSFFLFLGFGYFDPLHAFVTTVLLQLLLLAVFADLPRKTDPAPPDLDNDWRWKLALWGQLVFIVHGMVILVAGIVICWVAVTSVFVATDLEFMQTSAEALEGAHPRLVPLVAHDRATFGGMLIACGLTVFLSTLWGFRRGHLWHWWALVLAGNAAYLATLAVHLHVGYHSLFHLMPVYGGLTALWVGSALAYPFLCDRGTLESAPPVPSAG